MLYAMYQVPCLPFFFHVCHWYLPFYAHQIKFRAKRQGGIYIKREIKISKTGSSLQDHAHQCQTFHPRKLC